MARRLFTFLQLYSMDMVFMYVSASSSHDFVASSADGENGHVTSEPKETGKLDMVALNPEKNEGVYHSSGGGGVRFVSEAVGESRYLGLHTLIGDMHDCHGQTVSDIELHHE